MRRCLVFSLLGLALLSAGRAEPPTPTPAAPPAPPEKPVAPAAAPGAAKWTVDDVLLAARAGDFRFAPDGHRVAWVKSVMDTDRGERVGHLVRTDLADGSEVELTRGPDSCFRPRWSPDGKRLAFLSARPAPKGKAEGGDDEPRQQVWLLDPTGGEPWRLTALARGVRSFDWAGNDDLVVLAQEDAGRRESRLKEDSHDDTVVVEEERYEPPVRLFRVAVKTKKVTRLTDNVDFIEGFTASPDGRYAVATHQRSLRYTYDNRVRPVVVLYDLADGKKTPIFAEGRFNLSAVLWAPDGTGFYAVNEASNHPELSQAGVSEVYYFELATGVARKVDLGWERGLAWQWHNDGLPSLLPLRDGFLALLHDGVRNRAARFRRDGAVWKREWLAGEHVDHLFGWQATEDGHALLYCHATASSPPRWYSARLDGARVEQPVALPDLDEALRRHAVARTEVVRWKGAADEEVEGILSYPHAWRPGAKAPLVVMIHGGPASADLDCWGERWSQAPNLLCQRGAFVLRVNYHGSAGYGPRWLESITDGHYLELETVDIEKGVDALIARGLVDPERLGLYGWSNGAILTNLLTTQTTRYRAAVAGAGSIEYVSDWANCEFGDAFDRYYFGASPLRDPERYLKKSPFYRLDRVRTPTLILFGGEDRVVPTSQGWVHFRALQQLAQAPVRFVLFPGAGHALTRLAHQRRKLEEELAWFDRHLFGKAAEEDDALKPGSPLASALKRRQARRDGDRYGVADRGKLIPETVPHGKYDLGRFEVTRAQYAAFEPAYPVPPGTDNYPANGITFEQARAYCEWLSRHTGRVYRLPTAAEADELYADQECGDNTLDWWAGYALNPEDAERVRSAAKALGEGAPLLREVGSFRAAGDAEAVFDLGGNVAEWTVGEDGKGVLRGGSADQPADPKRATTAAPEYRGFRVLREGPRG